MQKEEEQLIRKAQRGNLQAFENLVHRYDAKIMRLIFNMVNDREDTRDIYQEVFLKAFKSISMVENRNPENQLINKELNDQIQQSIDKLSAKQRSVFILKHYHGYKLSEIAAILNCSEGTIKNYMFRAVQKMRKSLKAYHQI